MEMKIYQYDARHMTEMVAMPIFGKTLQKSSEPAGRFPRNWTPAHHSLIKL